MAMVDSAVGFFYSGESLSNVAQMLDSLLNRCQEIIRVNMWLSASLTLGILKSLYPWANLDAAGEGFATTCSDEEALKLVKDSTMMTSRIVDMLGINMSFG
jgi:hypothetical protein